MEEQTEFPSGGKFDYFLYFFQSALESEIEISGTKPSTRQNSFNQMIRQL